MPLGTPSTYTVLLGALLGLGNYTVVITAMGGGHQVTHTVGVQGQWWPHD